MKKTFQILAFLFLSGHNLAAQWTPITNVPVAPIYPSYISNMDIDGNNLYAIADGAILKSSNNGDSWTEILPVDYSLYPQQVEAVGSTVCLIVYDGNAGTSVFYYSNDGGDNFQQGGPDFVYVDALFVQNNKVFVLDDSGFYVSNDGGATFTNTGLVAAGIYIGDIEQTPVGKILMLTALDPNTFEVLGTFAWKSTDDMNWTTMNISGGSNPLPCKQNSQAVYWSSISHINGAILFSGYNPNGNGGLYKTDDQGANWYQVAVGQFDYSGYITAFNGSRAYARDDSYNLLTSTDGANWTTTNTPAGADPFDGAGTKFAAGGSEGFWLSSDNGNTWAHTSGGLYNGRDIVYDYLSSGNTKFLVTQWNGIFRGTGSDPANLTWTKVLGTDVNGGGDMGWDILKKGNTLLAGIDFIGGGQQGIYRSTNNGNTWTRTHTGAGLCFFDDGNTIYAGVDYNGVLKSTNQGQTWTAINNGFPANTNLLSPSEILRAGNNLITSFFFGGIYVSSNNGSSWTQTSTQGLVYCMAKSGSVVFAGTTGGLLKSTDQGETWELIQNDITGIAVTALYVQADDELYIGTGNQGMYLSTDGGETLEPHNDGAGDNNYVSYLGRDGSKLLAGWNNNPYFSAYYYIPAQFGRVLWYENAGNSRPSPSTDRNGNLTEELRLAIYPNLVQDVLQFTTTADPAAIARVELINGNGQTVRDLQGGNLRPALDVRDLPSGPYFFRMTMQDGNSMVRRFTVQKVR